MSPTPRTTAMVIRLIQVQVSEAIAPSIHAMRSPKLGIAQLNTLL